MVESILHSSYSTTSFFVTIKMCDIYFCGSIRSGRQDAEIYRVLIKKLKEYGTVLTEFVGTLKLIEEEGDNGHHEKLSDAEIHERDMKLLEQSDVLVAEVTQPSLGVGYEIGQAIASKKPILCLYRPSGGKLLSALIRGIHNGKSVVIADYKMEDVDAILKDFFLNNHKEKVK